MLVLSRISIYPLKAAVITRRNRCIYLRKSQRLRPLIDGEELTHWFSQAFHRPQVYLEVPSKSEAVNISSEPLIPWSFSSSPVQHCSSEGVHLVVISPRCWSHGGSLPPALFQRIIDSLPAEHAPCGTNTYRCLCKLCMWPIHVKYRFFISIIRKVTYVSAIS